MDPTVLTTVAVAMGAGAAGNVIGKSPITGEQPWNKVLGPLGALLAPWIAKQVFKADLTSEQVMMIGTTASGLWSQGKNLYQFVRGIFKKGLKK
jgi:hypothetical protein